MVKHGEALAEFCKMMLFAPVLVVRPLTVNLKSTSTLKRAISQPVVREAVKRLELPG
jgi:hypothetical protein